MLYVYIAVQHQGLTTNPTGGQVRKESEHLRALQGFPQDDFVVFIHTVNLENLFGNIQPNTCNVHDQPLAVDGNLSFPAWHRRCH